MLEITFEIHLLVDGNLVQVPETILQSEVSKYSRLIKQQRSLEGILRIKMSEQGEIELADDLSSLTQRLCFGAIPKLTESFSSSFTYDFFSQDERLVVTPENEGVKLFVEEEPELVIPKTDFITALFNCGNRFLDLLEKFGNDFQQLLEYLKPFGEKARPYVDRVNSSH